MGFFEYPSLFSLLLFSSFSSFVSVIFSLFNGSEIFGFRNKKNIHLKSNPSSLCGLSVLRPRDFLLIEWTMPYLSGLSRWDLGPKNFPHSSTDLAHF